MGSSEVANLREQIAREVEAMERGLCGVAMSSRHDIIQAKFSHIGECLERLEWEVGKTEAIKMVIEILG